MRRPSTLSSNIPLKNCFPSLLSSTGEWGGDVDSQPWWGQVLNGYYLSKCCCRPLTFFSVPYAVFFYPGLLCCLDLVEGESLYGRGPHKTFAKGDSHLRSCTEILFLLALRCWQDIKGHNLPHVG